MNILDMEVFHFLMALLVFKLSLFRGLVRFLVVHHETLTN